MDSGDLTYRCGYWDRTYLFPLFGLSVILLDQYFGTRVSQLRAFKALNGLTPSKPGFGKKTRPISISETVML